MTHNCPGPSDSKLRTHNSKLPPYFAGGVMLFKRKSGLTPSVRWIGVP
jgi:hypothetical protein